MKKTSTSLVQAFLFAFAYGILFYMLQFFFAETTMLGVSPTAARLKSWDVPFYESIARGGYGSLSNNTGFFILFPLLWKLCGLGVWGITLLNLFCFAIGFALLSRVLEVTDKTVFLLWLTLPSLYFCFLPYTESLSFLLGAILLYALKKDQKILLWIALFFISLVRPTATMLIPAFMAMELFSNPRNMWLRSITRASYLYLLPMLLALALFITWQYLVTGVWFIYFKTQAATWGHTFSLPGIPFSNIENATLRYHWLSALGMLVDTFAFFLLLRAGILWLKQKPPQDKLFILASTYLVMVLLSLLFFNPKYGGPTTNIMGANRHSFTSPFFLLFLYHLSRIKYSLKHILGVFLFINAFWFLFGAYDNCKAWYTIALVNNSIIIAFMFWRSKESYSWLAFPIIAFNFFVQVHLFQQFITPLYVD